MDKITHGKDFIPGMTSESAEENLSFYSEDAFKFETVAFGQALKQRRVTIYNVVISMQSCSRGRTSLRRRP